ncbi:MAG: aspartyl protease family protein [Cyclobacteriaceae bacterium]
MKRFLVILFVFAAFKPSAQTPLATVPFELYGEHLFIKLSVNGSDELDFIFDTGDGLTVLSLDAAKRLNIMSDKKVKETSAGGSVTGYLVKHNDIKISGIEIHNVKIYENDLNHLERAIGRKIDGIIGYDLLHNFVVEIDYNSMELHVFDASKFEYMGDGTPMKIKFRHAIPMVPGIAILGDGEMLMGNFYLETGAKTDLDFNTPYVKENELKSKIGNSYTYLVSGISENETLHTRGRINTFTIAGYTFKNLPVGLSEGNHGIQADSHVAGVVGNEILHRFNATFDYKHHKMWWSQNDKFKGQFFVNCSGILLQLDKSLEKVLIHQVYDDSPALEAGLKVDDEIVAVDGKKGLTLVQIRDILATDGKTVTLKINSGGESKDVKLELKALI